MFCTFTRDTNVRLAIRLSIPLLHSDRKGVKSAEHLAVQ